MVTALSYRAWSDDLAPVSNLTVASSCLQSSIWMPEAVDMMESVGLHQTCRRRLLMVDPSTPVSSEEAWSWTSRGHDKVWWRRWRLRFWSTSLQERTEQ
jgi:hypothetical protein